MSAAECPTEVLSLSAADQAALVSAGEVSARELVEASLRRMDEKTAVNAFVHVCAERALAEADGIRPGDQRPLCGVPIGIKDLLSATEGLPTAHGSAAFGDWIADHDSAHVRRLRAAGAIVVGKTNTPELGLRPVTENARFGTTRNPRDERLSPGGSSGGSAAAVAADLIALADGSDMGGSIRIPASCCGLVGLKPSRGRVPVGPDLGDVGAGVLSYGVLTRTVLDTAVALDALAGYEPGERHAPAAGGGGFAAATRTDQGRVPVRLALRAPLGVPVDREPCDAARIAAAAFDGLGHDVDELVPDWDDESFPSSWETFATGAMRHIVRVLERLHGRAVDVARLEPATRGWLTGAPPVALLEYLEAAERLWAFGRRLLRSWPEGSVLVTPTLTRLPPLGGHLTPGPGVTDDAVRYSALTRIWNVTGQPAISLPIHTTADGVPVGVQLIGPPGRDDLVLTLAAQLEQHVGWRPRPPEGS